MKLRRQRKAVAALPQEEFANNRLLREFRNFSVKPRWRPVVKHRRNVGKSSFRKLTTEMSVEVTLRTTLSNFVRVRCESFGQFRRLVRTKIRPSSIIYTSRGGPPSASFHCSVALPANSHEGKPHSKEYLLTSGS